MNTKGVIFTKEAELNDPFLKPLFSDLCECDSLLTAQDSQFLRRTFVRASFAFYEGWLYWLKGQVIKWLLGTGWKNRQLDISKLTLLQDSVPKATKQGRVELEANRLPFLNYCALVLRTAAECAGLDPACILSDNGWNELQTGMEVRHRLTHPKKPEDLEVTDGELESVRRAHLWMFNSVVGIVNAAITNKMDAL